MFPFQRRKKAQRKHQAASAKRSRSGAAAPSRLFLEPLEERTLLSVNYTNIPTALDAFLPAVQQSANEQMFPANGVDLPIVGTALQANNISETQFITSIQNTLHIAFSGVTLNSYKTVESVIQSALPNETTITAFGQGIYYGDPNNAANTQTTFQVTISASTVVSEPLNFDSGLTGLGLKLNSTPIKVTLAYAVQLNFTATDTGDVLVVPNPNPPLVSLTVTAQITSIGTPDTLGPLNIYPNGNISATDGSLPSPWQTKDGTSAQSNLNAVLNLTPSLGQVSYTTLSNYLDANGAINTKAYPLSFTLTGQGNINLGIVLNIQSFPSVASNMDVSWPLSQGQKPTVIFNDVQMDVGSFFGNIIAPVLGKIEDVTKNFQPVIDALNQPVPVLSFLGINVTLMQYLQTNMPWVATFLSIVKIINSLPQAAQSGSTLMQFGSFNPNVDVSQNPLSSSQQQTTTGTNWGAIDIQLGNDDKGDLQNLQKIENLGQNGPQTGVAMSLAFPILGIGAPFDPTQVFKMFLGEPATLVTGIFQFFGPYNPPDLHIPIIGPLNIVVHTEFSFSASLTLGYDTYGLENNKPLEGFFLSGAKLELDAKVQAGPDFKVPGIELNVTGGIEGTATLGLHDPSTEGVYQNQPETPNNGPDGLVRPQEIVDDVNQFGVLGLFDATGEIDANLDAHAEVGFNTPSGLSASNTTRCSPV